MATRKKKSTKKSPARKKVAKKAAKKVAKKGARKKSAKKTKAKRKRNLPIRPRFSPGMDLIQSYFSGGRPDRPNGGDLWLYRGWTIDVYRDANDMWHWIGYAPLAVGDEAYWYEEPDVTYVVRVLRPSEVVLEDTETGGQVTVDRNEVLGEPIPSKYATHNEFNAKFDATFTIDFMLHTDELEQSDPEKFEQVMAIAALTKEGIDRARSKGLDPLAMGNVAREIELMRNDSDYSIRAQHAQLSEMNSTEAGKYIEEYLGYRQRIEESPDVERFFNPGRGRKAKKRSANGLKKSLIK